MALLIEQVGKRISELLKEGFYEIHLSQEEAEELALQKKRLRNSLWHCATGNQSAREYVKTVIQELLAEYFALTEEEMEQYISFENSDKLTAWDKFQIILYYYTRQFQECALSRFICDYDLAQKRENGARYIDSEDIDRIFNDFSHPMDEMDKLAVLTQRVYSLYRGLGIADDILMMDIDGVSGGVSGNKGSNKTLWIYFEGKSIQLRFLVFGSEKELERICCNIYRHNRPGQLTRTRGYIVNDMADHSRVVVARPPFCESWVFFVRKFGKKNGLSEEELYHGKNIDKVLLLLKILITGCQNCAITGMQGTGKTTLLMLLISYISPGLNLRIQELAFELHLRDIYPERNIVTFRETETISGQEGLDLQKKTDGSVNIIGEVATAPVAGWLMQAGQTASMFTLFTHHGKTAQAMVQSLANALLSEGLIDNERAALHQVAEVVRIDIHMAVSPSGERYIQRVSEIRNKENEVEIKDIFIREKGEYIQKNNLSRETCEQMLPHLKMFEREALYHELSVSLS